MTDLSLEVTPIPGLVVLRLDVREDSRGWFKENWQREKMVGLGLPDFGPGAAQRLLQHRPWRDPRHPHRAVGQVRLDPHRSGLRRVGRHARGADVRHGLHRRDGPARRGVRAARGRQQLPDARGRHDLQLPRQRALAAGTAYPALNLDDATAGHRLADPARRVRDLREGPEHPGDGRRRAHEAAQDPDRRSPRPAGPGPPGRLPRRCPRGPGRWRQGRRPRRVRSRPGHGVPVARVPAGAQRRGLHRRRQGRERGGPGGRLGGQRLGTRRARTDRDRAPPHAGALLHRLRLRRHGRGAHRGRAATHRSGSTRRPRRPATSRWPPRRATTSSARPG